MRKLMSVLCMMLLVLAVTACGSTDDNAEQSEANTSDFVVDAAVVEEAIEGEMNQAGPEGEGSQPPMGGPKPNMEEMLSVEEANVLEKELVDLVAYEAASGGYPIVDTNQTLFFSNDAIIESPSVGEDFYGQDASFTGNAPSYTDNGDGTITDNVTGLIWQQDPGDKLT